MQIRRKDSNLMIGKRLREARVNLNKDKEEFAAALDVTEEHYRKLEAGKSGLSADKILILYQKYGIDPTYLFTGINEEQKKFDLNNFVSNSSKEQRSEFFQCVLAYLYNLIK